MLKYANFKLFHCVRSNTSEICIVPPCNISEFYDKIQCRIFIQSLLEYYFHETYFCSVVCESLKVWPAVTQGALFRPNILGDQTISLPVVRVGIARIDQNNGVCSRFNLVRMTGMTEQYMILLSLE